MSDAPRPTLRPWLRRLTKSVVVLAVFLSVSFGLLRWYRHYRYPYGASHCCIKVLGLALANYADAHDGVFPRGEATPEASLSLLAEHELRFDEDPASAVEILRGKTVPADKVRERLAAGKPLDSQSCGWNYVEGLTLHDDPELAIVWDKVGLGHNGERLSDGGHEVLFVAGNRQMIGGKEWPAFLAHQKELLAARSAASPERDGGADRSE